MVQLRSGRLYVAEEDELAHSTPMRLSSPLSTPQASRSGRLRKNFRRG